MAAQETWTQEQMSRLASLWGQKLPDDTDAYSTAEVGRLLGKSKNAVVGKAHRMDLEPRKSPIKDRGTGKRRAVRVAPRVTLPSLAAPAPVVATPAPVPVPTPIPVRISNFKCVYPVGDPGAKTFHFCHAPAQLGSPYCHTHHVRCHVRMQQYAASA